MITYFGRLQWATSMQKEVKLKPHFMKPAVMCWHWAAANHSQMSFGSAAYTKFSFLMHNMVPIIISLFPLAFIFPQTRAAHYYFPLLPLSVQFLLYWLPGASFFLPSFNMGCKAACCLGFLFTIHGWICMLCRANFNWKALSFFLNGKCETESIFNALFLPVLESWVFF